MKSYAFPVELDDIYDVLLQLRNMGATWGHGRDPIDHFKKHIEYQFSDKNAIALYIEQEFPELPEENSKYRISYSSTTYLEQEFPSESDAYSFIIVDSFYSITEFASYSDLEDNTVNFCEI